MSSEQNLASELLEKLHSETALIRWQELQRFFAQGKVLLVEQKLDLVRIAMLFAEDQAKDLEPLISSGDIAAPSDELAKRWYNTDQELWSVVVAPFVLVQEANRVDGEVKHNEQGS